MKNYLKDFEVGELYRFKPNLSNGESSFIGMILKVGYDKTYQEIRLKVYDFELKKVFKVSLFEVYNSFIGNYNNYSWENLKQ